MHSGEPASLRSRVRAPAIYVAALVFAVALVVRFRSQGGPYFELPQTVQDHVSLQRYPSADAIVLSRNAAKLLPRGATVTVLLPSEAPTYDVTHYLTGVGLMPHQIVIAQNLDRRPDYVLALREPLDHPAYELMAEVEGGRIYRVRR
ncbi:MAG: hypothetical protein ABI779_20120 [Acidobacteriota bacterium]